MQLRRLAALERQKIEDEYNAMLPSRSPTTRRCWPIPARILGRDQDEVLDLKEKFGDERRTEIVRGGGRRLLRGGPDPPGGGADQRDAGQLHQADATGGLPGAAPRRPRRARDAHEGRG